MKRRRRGVGDSSMQTSQAENVDDDEDEEISAKDIVFV